MNSPRWSSNNLLNDNVLDHLKSFLDNKIRDWKLPIPSFKGPEYFLPQNFYWMQNWEDFLNNSNSHFKVKKIH